MIPARSTWFIFTFITCLNYAVSGQSSALAYPTLAQSQPQQSILENTTANFSGKSNSIVVAQAYPGATDMPTLNRGSKGEKVGEVQTQLKQLGFYDGPVDKSYGEKLQFAVAKFQNAVGLTADGVTTPATWQWLQIMQSQKSTAAATPPQQTQQTTPAPTPLQPTPQAAAVATPTPPTQQTIPVPTPLQPTPQGTAAATPTQTTQQTTSSSVQQKSSSEIPSATASSTQIAQNQNSTASKQTVATESESMPRWVWLLLGFVVTVVGVGGGIYLFMKLFGYEPFEEENQTETYTSPPPPRSRRVEPPIPKTKNTSPKNSYSSSMPRVAESSRFEPELKPQASAEALVVEQTTRLPKININDELIKDLREPNQSKRRKAIWELAQRGDSRAVQPLLDLMIDSDSTQRSLILEALSQIGIRTLKPMNRALAISLQDENAEVRKNAIRDLTRVYESLAQINQLLLHAADDQDSDVQQTAEWALGQLNRIRAASGVENGQTWHHNSGNSAENSSL
ncbi:MAG TPA: HEAT repeat domain-containing protein [Oculatellaceae cyanobacterium]|jgi:peptidoglycan hydrolase-like protein with peptidoglycan-binding domain